MRPSDGGAKEQRRMDSWPLLLGKKGSQFMAKLFVSALLMGISFRLFFTHSNPFLPLPTEPPAAIGLKDARASTGKQMAEVPHSTFQFNFDFEKEVLADIEQEDENRSRMSVEDQPTNPSTSSPMLKEFVKGYYLLCEMGFSTRNQTETLIRYHHRRNHPSYPEAKIGVYSTRVQQEFSGLLSI